MKNPTKHFSIAYITGDGIGKYVTPAMQQVMDAGFEKEYQGATQIDWIKTYAGQEAIKAFGEGLPKEQLDLMEKSDMIIKGPMGTPTGGGMRSLNVAARKHFDLYACIRPIVYYPGVPSPLLAPWGTNAVIFRENIEDVYSGIEVKAGTEEAKKVLRFLREELGRTDLDESMEWAFGIKNISKVGSERLINRAAEYAVKYNYDNLTLMHKGNIMKFTEGGFLNWGFDLVREKYPEFITKTESWILNNHAQGLTVQQNGRIIDIDAYDFGTAEDRKNTEDKVVDTLHRLRDDGQSWKSKKIIEGLIGDNTLQQAVLNPNQFGVIATTNLNGDYLSDALAAVVGGLGVAPGVNVNFENNMAMLAEATHGTAPTLTKGKANPSSLILSGATALEFKGHKAVADRIKNAIAEQFLSGRVTSDLIFAAQTARKKVVAQKDLNSKTLGIDHLEAYVIAQEAGLTLVTTDEFTNEVCQRIADAE